MYEAGDIERREKERRLERIAEELANLESRRVVEAIPTIDWSGAPRELNRVLRHLFERIDLDPPTFQPVAFEWRVPEWRA
jgi:hypothetical protein